MTEPHIELGPPPPLPEGGLRVIPLGGLGAIGRNMTVFEYDGRLLIVDCGVLFPDVDQPGVDLILPDFSSILDRLDDVQAIVLTHGHEDHIGAVPYLLAHKPDIPLVGSRFTLALVEAKLAERRIEPYTLTVPRAAASSSGPFECEFFAVNHSIPDALAVAIRTAGRDRAAHRRLQDGPAAAGRTASPTSPGSRGSGPRASTCCCRTRPTPRSPVSSPRSARSGPSSTRIFAHGQRADHRRLVRLARAPGPAGARRRARARAQGRASIGRSMVRNMGVARDLGLLRVPAGCWCHRRGDEAAPGPGRADVDRFAGRADERAGPDGQRRPPAHPDRRGRHGRAGLARWCPGNETAVYRVINRLARAGARRRAQGRRQGARVRACAGR